MLKKEIFCLNVYFRSLHRCGASPRTVTGSGSPRWGATESWFCGETSRTIPSESPPPLYLSLTACFPSLCLCPAEARINSYPTRAFQRQAGRTHTTQTIPINHTNKTRHTMRYQAMPYATKPYNTNIPYHTLPYRTIPYRTEQNRTEPNITKSTRTKPNQTKPNQTKPGKTNPTTAPRTNHLTHRHGKWKVEATLAGEHRNTIYSVDWAPTAADAAAATAAAQRSGGDSSEEGGGEGGGGMGAPCLATAAGDDALRVFYEEGEGDSAAFGLDVEVRGNGGLASLVLMRSAAPFLAGCLEID